MIERFPKGSPDHIMIPVQCFLHVEWVAELVAMALFKIKPFWVTDFRPLHPDLKLHTSNTQLASILRKEFSFNRQDFLTHPLFEICVQGVDFPKVVHVYDIRNSLRLFAKCEPDYFDRLKTDVTDVEAVLLWLQYLVMNKRTSFDKRT